MKRTNRNRAVLSIIAAGMATSVLAGQPDHLPKVSVTPLPVDIAADRAELEQTLVETWELLIARASGVQEVPLVDADATLSLEIPDHAAIRSALLLFTTTLQPKIQQSIHRSSRYKTMIDSIFDEEKLPRALAYLPVIESAFMPNLTSRAGARGLWQFMPATAREFGLRVDWWVDERTDPIKSTRAAAAYLKQLYRIFDDWPMALAAYNGGPGRLRRTAAKVQASDFWSLYNRGSLPRETRGYVPTFYATLLIVSDPPSYGFTLLPPQQTDEIELPIEGPVSLDFIAESAQIDAKALREANPAFTRGVLPPGVSRVRMAVDAAARVAPRVGSLRFEDSSVKITAFTLRKGDSLSTLARATGVSTQEIMSMNSLGKSKFKTGDSIYLPVRQTDLSFMLQRAASMPADRSYRVRKGDTLYSIAKKHGLSVAELADLNQLKKASTIHPGDRLRVSVGSAVATGGM